MTRRLVHAAVSIAVLAAATASAPVAARAGSAGVPDAPLGPAQLTLTSPQQLDPRLQELVFSTPALSAPTHVRVLLPADYAAHPTERYPVLYLLNGSVDNYTSWTKEGNAEALTAGLPLIVVMPDGGGGGFYSDWYNGGAGGPPEWETYHIDQLLPWIDGHYRTIGTRAGRAIAGLSMGGFGAMTYAARHPDLFVAAASFSGAVNTNEPTVLGEPDESTFDGGAPFSTWGPRATEEVIWHAHNPWDLAGNLRGLELTLRTGNGEPGGPYPYDPAAGAIEFYVHQASTDLHDQLVTLGIPHVWQDYGPGDHSWPYWQRDLQLTLPDVMATFAHPPAPPSPFSFTAAEPSYEIYGWNVSIVRPALELSTLSGAGADGFELSGSGAATVTTAPLYGPGTLHEVTIADGPSITRTTVMADHDGRLSVPVALGPGNPDQQYTPAAQLAGTAVYSANVTIAPVPRAAVSAAATTSPAACVSKRTLQLTIYRPRGARILAVSLLIDGVRLPHPRRHGDHIFLALAGRPRQTVRVRILTRESRGASTFAVSDRRTYHTCLPGPGPGPRRVHSR